jgi:hypothetical protein
MSARDKYHHIIRAALLRDGWTITHDPYRIAIAMKRVEIDLGAEQAIAAEKEHRKIAVEIKSFLSDSEMNDLENALGQYSLYRLMLLKKEPERVLYLAVPHTLHDLLLLESDFRYILRELQVCLIFYNVQTQEITEWIETPGIAL